MNISKILDLPSVTESESGCDVGTYFAVTGDWVFTPERTRTRSTCTRECLRRLAVCLRTDGKGVKMPFFSLSLVHTSFRSFNVYANEAVGILVQELEKLWIYDLYLQYHPNDWTFKIKWCHYA